MRIVCWQTILMKHHTLFFSKIGKYVSPNLSSAAVVIGTFRVKYHAERTCETESSVIRFCRLFLFLKGQFSSFLIKCYAKQ